MSQLRSSVNNRTIYKSVWFEPEHVFLFFRPTMLRINFENKFKVKIRVLKEGQGQFHFFNPCFSSEIRVSNIFQRFFEHSAQLWHRVVFFRSIMPILCGTCIRRSHHHSLQVTASYKFVCNQLGSNLSKCKKHNFFMPGTLTVEPLFSTQWPCLDLSSSSSLSLPPSTPTNQSSIVRNSFQARSVLPVAKSLLNAVIFASSVTLHSH